VDGEGEDIKRAGLKVKLSGRGRSATSADNSLKRIFFSNFLCFFFFLAL